MAQDTAVVLNHSSKDHLELSARVGDLHHKNAQRKWVIGSTSVVGYSTSMILLSQAWYKDYPRASFHTFNDAGEWMQMDKAGHAWGAYHTSRLTSHMWEWAGVKPNAAVFLGSGSSLLYLLSIEYLDGHSAAWGWSWPDVVADIAGSGLFTVQELKWHEQRVQLKFSSHYKKYNTQKLQQRADQLFGATFQERLLKDYNAQTYWLAINIRKMVPGICLPPWLNLAIGYGTSGVFGGFNNLAVNNNGDIVFDAREIKRYRQWYLAPDIDLTRIKTRSGFLKTIFSTLNVLKFPSPALEFSKGKFKLKGLAF